MKWTKAILHIDGDAFFASCEQAVHAEYQGKPVVTGKERGIVSAASYEAKAKGVSRGVPLWEVPNLCPEAIIVPSDYETYSLFSERMFEIMRRFTDSVEEYSIDEGFVDLTGWAETNQASYSELAWRIKQTIQRELGITVSVGLSTTKVLAKSASKFHKPDGFTVIAPGDHARFLAVTPVSKVWGIGPSSAQSCNALGIYTALDYILQSEKFIAQYFAKPQLELWYELRGESIYQVEQNDADALSISKTRTFTPASNHKEFVFAQLLKNLENACIKARRQSLVAQECLVYLKRQDFLQYGEKFSLSRASAYPQDITPSLRRVFDNIFSGGKFYRATGVTLIGLISEHNIQTNLFEPTLSLTKLRSVYRAVDSLSARFGKHTVHLAGSLPAHITQHDTPRGDVPLRKTKRLLGETRRRHLRLPMLIAAV